MCIVCFNRINLYLRFKRAVLFDLLAFMGEESRGKRVVVVKGKATRKCSTVAALYGLTGEDVRFNMLGVGGWEHLTL